MKRDLFFIIVCFVGSYLWYINWCNHGGYLTGCLSLLEIFIGLLLSFILVIEYKN